METLKGGYEKMNNKTKEVYKCAFKDQIEQERFRNEGKALKLVYLEQKKDEEATERDGITTFQLEMKTFHYPEEFDSITCLFLISHIVEGTGMEIPVLIRRKV